ncbi:TGF-beta receptor type-1-like [Sycon ciliatum]|uniref:TGF-beta receptor type-1-like n=1 Tax=Sycon ciliatum TaxID=27933 RepID=UPI0020A9CA22|eukprot:scpid52872/ scgid32419/ TGF-beta receptor type-1; Serine/threonine-protein kinase receptor R4; TGF-beta type I receptor; Transforming growth factor-beta receptor type I
MSALLCAVLVATQLLLACRGQPLICRQCSGDQCKDDKGTQTCEISEEDRNAIPHGHMCVAEINGFIPETGDFHRVQYKCTAHFVDTDACTRASKLLTDHTILYCCSDHDLCNAAFPPANLTAIVLSTPTATSATSLPALTEKVGAASWELPVAITLPVVIGSIFLVTIVIFVRSKSWKSNQPSSRMYDPDIDWIDGEPYPPVLNSDEISITGEGHTRMAPLTLSRTVVPKENIGNGRYGSVLRGTWRGGQEVAVKIFQAMHDRSYMHEVDIYKTPWLRHENVLGFIGCDSRDDGMSTQFWMVMDYCHYGSMLDYITNPNVQLTVEKALKLMMTASRGLTHLHSSVAGPSVTDSKNNKPAMAHRDVKSRNFLVRRDGTACIADLGLAIRENDADMPWNSQKALAQQSDMGFRRNTTDKDSGQGSMGNSRVNTAVNGFIPQIPFNYRVGTRRYMAPEILNETIRVDKFDSFRRTDVYSFALVLWEVCRRTHIEGVAMEYEQPYQGMVPSDPELEDVRQVVVVDQCRPAIPEQWREARHISNLVTHLEEAWCDDSQARCTMMRLMKKLEGLYADAQAARRESRESAQIVRAAYEMPVNVE